MDMSKEQLDELEQRLLFEDSRYPIEGSFLQKYQYIDDSKILYVTDKEKEEFLVRAKAEGETYFKRRIQYWFGLYPYED